ncbi:uncharacterized protein LOC117330730 isoform X2 [Pecten maximus]|uniref:uncharacterized protein LOC117330730 isoform X2 n=1 Tax=Pecten maximus TaxID=6579 RepID=UPI0014586E47|nr:uncharacterized protein LOC117330730 isoform X2 [Pecten maximus]
MAHHHFRQVVGTVCLCCNLRDTDLPDIKNMQWTENAHGIGTIPGHMSIRVPPASIGIGGKKEKLIGITNHEVSERYILKLQRDRERNNQAVFKSLENLPITIRHVPKYRIQSEPTVHTTCMSVGTEARPSSMRSMSPEEISYQRLLNTTDANLNMKSSDSKAVGKGSQEILRSEFKKSKMAGPMCPHLMSLSACRKCARLKRRRKKPDTKKDITSAVTTGILGNDLNIQAEGNGNTSQDTMSSSTQSESKKVVYTGGFHGHQLRPSKSVKFPSKKKGLSVGLPISGSLSFQKKYTRVFDSNQQIHFVNTSLLAGQRAGTLGKTFKKLPGILAAGESQHRRENTEVFAIKSVQRYNDPFPQTSTESQPTVDIDMSPAPVPIQPMHSFASDISDMQMANLDGRVHGEQSDEGKPSGPFLNTHDYNVPKSDIELQNLQKTKNIHDTEESQKVHETQKDKQVPLSRSDSEVFACRAQHMTPGKVNSKANLHSSKTGSYDTGYQKEPSRIIKAACKQDKESQKRKVAPEMQFSVRIEYKSTDDEPTPRESTYSEIVNMPRWLEKEKSNVESIAQKSIRDSAVEDTFHERRVSDASAEGGINDASAESGINDLSYSNKNSQQYAFDIEGKDDNRIGELHILSQETISIIDDAHDDSQFTDKNISKPNEADGDTFVQSTEVRQKSSPESGFDSLLCDSEETTVQTDALSVESGDSTSSESAETAPERKLVTPVTSQLNVGDRQVGIVTDGDQVIEIEKSGVINGSDITHRNSDVSDLKDDDFDVSNNQTGDKSPDYVIESAGGFFVTTLDPTEQDDTDDKEILSGSDSGIAQDDVNILKEFTSDDIKEAKSPQKVKRPSGIGIGLSHDIQA